MRDISQTYEIKSPIEKVWQALVDPIEIDQWGAGPADMDEKEGSEFSLWGGDIWGRNIEIAKPNKLVQEWYSGKWSQPSIVTFTLTENDAVTRVDFEQKNIPDEEVDDIDDGWKRYYLGPMKEYLEK